MARCLADAIVGQALGAVPADVGQGDVPWQVLADPEGNDLRARPRPAYRDTGPVAAIVADCTDLDVMAGFWEVAAGWTRRGAANDRGMLRSPRDTGPFLELQRVPEVKAVKNRVHVDVAPEKGEDLAGAVRFLREADAVAADIGQGDVDWEVMADPEGHEFCVLTPRLPSPSDAQLPRDTRPGTVGRVRMVRVV